MLNHGTLHYLIGGDNDEGCRIVDFHHERVSVVKFPESYPRHGNDGFGPRREQRERGAEDHPPQVAEEKNGKKRKEKSGRRSFFIANERNHNAEQAQRDTE